MNISSSTNGQGEFEFANFLGISRLKHPWARRTFSSILIGSSGNLNSGRSRLLEDVVGLNRLTKFGDGRQLDLPDALPADAHLLTDAFQRLALAAIFDRKAPG